ncbi:unnamed protein product, partial [Staurois parvus]
SFPHGSATSPGLLYHLTASHSISIDHCTQVIMYNTRHRGGLTTHGVPGLWGIMGPLCPCPNSKKPMKKVPGASHGAPY